jgi:hypothetical protein
VPAWARNQAVALWRTSGFVDQRIAEKASGYRGRGINTGRRISMQHHDTNEPCAVWCAELPPLRETRALIERVLARLAVTDDPTERADLGSELARAASRYLDTFERTVIPRLAATGVSGLEGLSQDYEHLREVMTVVHERTMHVDPRNVHASDPQGFEDALEDVDSWLRAILTEQDRMVRQLLEHLAPDEYDQLNGEVRKAFRHASERPRPPRTALGKALSNAHSKLDHRLEDVATPRHPGAGTVDG